MNLAKPLAFLAIVVISAAPGHVLAEEDFFHGDPFFSDNQGGQGQRGRQDYNAQDTAANFQNQMNMVSSIMNSAMSATSMMADQANRATNQAQQISNQYPDNGGSNNSGYSYQHRSRVRESVTVDGTVNGRPYRR